jgi:hypothetical protein
VPEQQVDQGRFPFAGRAEQQSFAHRRRR